MDSEMTQHRKFTMEKTILQLEQTLLQLEKTLLQQSLPGLEPTPFQSRVRRSNTELSLLPGDKNQDNFSYTNDDQDNFSLTNVDQETSVQPWR